MPVHYRVERAFDHEFLGWLDVDPSDKAEILARLHVRKHLPVGLKPEDLYVLVNTSESLEIRLRSNDAVGLFLWESAIGSVQPEADAAQCAEDALVETYLDTQEKRAAGCLRGILNELKAIEEAATATAYAPPIEDLRDRRSVGREMDWLAVYLDNGGKAPPVKAIIAEAFKLPVQA